MANPKQKHTKSRRNKRRMHLYIDALVLTKCSKCGKPTKPHIVCPSCGFYKGVEAVNVLAKLTKKERKQKEKEMAAHEHEEKEGKPLSAEGLSK
jgi:large subunit ribosomal protein L32